MEKTVVAHFVHKSYRRPIQHVLEDGWITWVDRLGYRGMENESKNIHLLPHYKQGFVREACGIMGTWYTAKW